MLDRFNRHITYLRISVTDRCNLRCVYCMPERGIELIPKDEILSLEEIADVVRVAADLGVRKIRLTGGEPLVRQGIVDLTDMIRKIKGIEEIGMTTNGVLLAQYADDLKKAGLNRVNVSLDSVSPEKYSEITRGGDLEAVFAGIRAAIKAGLTPVKINVVRLNKGYDQEIQAIKEYAEDQGVKIRFISQMDLRTGEFSPVEGGDGGNCEICNRLRLTANGMLKPCLFSNREYSVREHGIREAFLMALNAKPEKGIISDTHSFYNIGG